MKRFLLAALAATTLLAIPATASASVSGAERAVDREVRFDYGYGDNEFSTCHKAGYKRYSCNITIIDREADDGVFDGKARVTQHGKHYSVSYRIYW
jgi:hypothetical protein